MRPSPGLFLFILLALASCSSLPLGSLEDGESLAGSSMGLLTGSIEWRQAGRAFQSQPGFELVSQDVGLKYRHTISGNDFYVALPPGRYYFSELHAGNPEIHTTTGRKIARAVPFLLLVVPLPLTSMAFVFFTNAVVVTPPANIFEIKPNRATYIGALTIEIPDPFPFMFRQPQYTVSDEGDRAAAELLSRVPGIAAVERHVLFKPEETTGQVEAESD